MKILKEGKIFTKTYRGVCEKCGCEVECEHYELHGIHFPIGFGLTEVTDGVTCPTLGCKSGIKMKEIYNKS